MVQLFQNSAPLLKVSLSKLVFVLSISLFAGCAQFPAGKAPVVDSSSGSNQSTTEPPVSDSSKPRTTKPETEQDSSYAVYGLMNKAQNQFGWQQYDSAAATLERAIRIAPRNPELYYRLALVRSKQEHPAKAQQLCRKAIAVSEDRAYYQRKCEPILD